MRRILWAKRLLLTSILLGLCVASYGCRKVDLRTAAIQVPGMKSEECALIVVNALGREQKIKLDNMSVDLQRRMIEVRYDSLRHSLKNLEYTIAKAGFQANEIPADETAQRALPEGCRDGGGLLGPR